MLIGSECNNRQMRHDRLHHAYQGDLKKNLQHFFQWQHVKADPEICKIILEDQPKKKHRALPASVEKLLQNPSQTSMPAEPVNLDDSFQSSTVGDSEIGDVEEEEIVSQNL